MTYLDNLSYVGKGIFVINCTLVLSHVCLNHFNGFFMNLFHGFFLYLVPMLLSLDENQLLISILISQISLEQNCDLSTMFEEYENNEEKTKKKMLMTVSQQKEGQAVTEEGKEGGGMVDDDGWPWG